MKKDKIFIALIIGLLCLNAKCSNKDQPTPPAPPTPSPATNDISVWITKGDRSALLQKQNNLSFTSASNTNPTVEVDSTITYQTIDGFGYTLTGGSAYLINRLAAAQKTSLLQELFGSGENSNAISYLRISIGASDLSAEVFSYDDMPTGQTDVNLANFSLSKDTVDVTPLLKLWVHRGAHRFG